MGCYRERNHAHSAACNYIVRLFLPRAVGSTRTYSHRRFPLDVGLVQPAVESFASHWHQDMPWLEATGTALGFKPFCKAADFEPLDAVISSRPMTERERATCSTNGVDAISKIPVGRDAAVMALPPADRDLAYRDLRNDDRAVSPAERKSAVIGWLRAHPNAYAVTSYTTLLQAISPEGYLIEGAGFAGRDQAQSGA